MPKAALLYLIGLLAVVPLPAAPVPKPQMAKAEDLTDPLVELLELPVVQKELQLSTEARVKLIDGFDELREAVRRAPVVSLPPSVAAAAAKGSPVAHPAWERPARARRELAAANLTRGQLARLQQLEVQAIGVYAFKLKRVADVLKLTDEQSAAVDAALPPLTDYGSGQSRPSRVPSPKDFEPVEGVVKGLTADQVRVWKELAGEAVKFDPQRMACLSLVRQITTTPKK